MYKVYAKLDNKKCITAIESTAFNSEEELVNMNFVFIDEGEDGETYGHAQPNYLQFKYGQPTFDEKFLPNFKLENGKVVLLSETEKQSLFPPVISEPTEQEKFNAKIMKELASLKVSIMRGAKNV